MSHKLAKDEELLNQEFRSRILAEISTPENIERKNFALRRHEIYRDRIKKWVMEALNKEGLSAKTLAQMENRAANISICKKVVNKLARLYVGSVIRKVDDKPSQLAIDDLTDVLCFDSKMKKADRYRQLFKNCLIRVMPEKDSVESTEGEDKFTLKMNILAPWQYDVVEDANDKEKARVIILSDFVERNNSQTTSLQNSDLSDGRTGQGIVPQWHQGDRKDQAIADTPEDAGQEPDNRRFIWWNKTYHFTTDAKGQIVEDLSPEDSLNPIGKLPFCNAPEDQDGEFWAQGGEDLVDGCVLVNQQITDMNSIMYIQGWGQPFITGKDVTAQMKEGGPHTAITIDVEEDDPTPTFEYVNASPPIDAWMKTIEQYVALLLSTNNLSPGNVSGKLDASVFPSGIAAVVEMSEANNSLQDSEKTFQGCERETWSIVQAWMELLSEKKALNSELEQIGSFPDADVTVKYTELKPAVTEGEKLDNLKKRKDLDINRRVELILIDEPDLGFDDAMLKLKEIDEEKLKRAQMLTNQFMEDEDGLPETNQRKETSQAEEIEVNDG